MLCWSARVRALEEKIPAVERPVRKYLPGGEPLPSKVVGEGTLLSRVAALERAMEALLQAQVCGVVVGGDYCQPACRQGRDFYGGVRLVGQGNSEGYYPHLQDAGRPFPA